MIEGVKQFKDPVHGYIAISVDFCDKFIDTAIFQRLRNIEQTSMRCLFPGAHHDRFVHSIGVFHLGRRVYEALKQNTTVEILKELQDDKLRQTFLVACLMHDCVHAPFSHTLEKYYNEDGKTNHKVAFLRLKEIFSIGVEERDHEFDFSRGKAFNEHEAMSAIVLKRYFEKGNESIFDCDLAARMIIGRKKKTSSSRPLTLRNKIENALITLLNSSAIDVDKLDYVLRDTWASGVKNFSVDIDRLLQSATLVMEKEEIHVAYKNAALSVIQSVIDARNYLFTWIYNHHTVLYYAELLNLAVKDLGQAIDGKKGNGFCLKALFSEEAFGCAMPLRSKRDKLCMRLPNDGDILSLIKVFRPDSVAYRIYESRQERHFALWKTESEHRLLFGEHSFKLTKEDALERIKKEFEISAFDIICCKANPKRYTLEPSDIKIDFNGQLKSFTEVVRTSNEVRANGDFYYIYLAKSWLGKKQEILESLINYVRS